MFVIRHKLFFFILSILLVLASITAVIVWGLQPSVDFVGGSIVEVRFEGTKPSHAALQTSLEQAGFEDLLIRESEDHVIIRTKTLSQGETEKLTQALTIGSTTIARIERSSSVGPSVGEELRRKTYIAIVLVVLMIIFYIAFAFRKVSKPISSWMYGIVAIITLLHDVIIPIGAFAVLGYTIGLEADTLFVVALLTILGLSVNDTIVVFDRIRENLRINQEQHNKESFAETVGKSLEQTYVRSFNTSFTVILVLLVLYFLGGPTIHTFILTLLVGQIAGTYSSIFIASPLLVVMAGKKGDIQSKK